MLFYEKSLLFFKYLLVIYVVVPTFSFIKKIHILWSWKTLTRFRYKCKYILKRLGFDYIPVSLV